MSIYLICFFINTLGAGFAYMGDNSFLLGLNLTLALFNGFAYFITFEGK